MTGVQTCALPISSLKVGGVDRLDHLTDVTAAGETDGAVPVYDSGSDKYIVKKINLGTDVSGDLDGGTF